MNIIRTLKLQKIYNGDKISDVQNYIFSFFESHSLLKEVNYGNLYLFSKNGIDYISIFEKNGKVIVIYNSDFKNNVLKKFGMFEVEFKLYLHVFFEKFLTIKNNDISILESPDLK